MSQSLRQEIENLNDATYNFTGKMRQKLKEKARKGYRGWDDKENEQMIKDKLQIQTTKLINGDYSKSVNVANLAMMLDKMFNE